MANPPRKGLKDIRAVWTDTVRDKPDEAMKWLDPNLPRDGIKPGKWDGHPFASMPPNCPVDIVGRDTDGVVYAISATGHLRKVEKWDQPTIASLFAPLYCEALWAWPNIGDVEEQDADGQKRTTKKIKRFEVQQCAAALIQEAARKGDFDPLTQHRGRGGWADSNGKFIWHSGECLWTARPKGKEHALHAARPAQHDGYLYTRQQPTIAPWSESVTAEESPAQQILNDLKTWNWQRPYLDPALLLGWIVTALMGGALKARPIVFTTGGHGVGKSTLHELIKHVLHNVVFTAVDTTAAGIYQKVKHDALPFLVDELEAKSGSAKAQSVIELARVAYTGGDISRGGSDHEGVTFKMHTSFFFSAINPPPMGSQDKSRMAVLNLGRLKTADGPRQAPRVSDVDGRKLLRQIMDGWDHFNLTLMPDYWETLHAQGFDARQIDTFGTLLAAAELVVGKEALEAMGLPVADTVQMGEILKEATALERSETLPNWHKCLNKLLDAPIDAWRDGVKPLVGDVCNNLRKGDFELRAARERLALVNLGAVQQGMLGLDSKCLAVPADGSQLDKIFSDSEYFKGGWFGALKQAPPHIVIQNPAERQTVKIGGNAKRCLFVDLEAFHKFTGSVED